MAQGLVDLLKVLYDCEFAKLDARERKVFMTPAKKALFDKLLKPWTDYIYT